jgi:hypothetical protein
MTWALQKFVSWCLASAIGPRPATDWVSPGAWGDTVGLVRRRPHLRLRPYRLKGSGISEILLSVEMRPLYAELKVLLPVGLAVLFLTAETEGRGASLAPY